LNTKEDILKIVGNQKAHSWWIPVFVCVQQNKEAHLGLERHMGE